MTNSFKKDIVVDKDIKGGNLMNLEYQKLLSYRDRQIIERLLLHSEELTNEILESEEIKDLKRLDSIRTRLFNLIAGNVFDPEALITSIDFKPTIKRMQGGQYRIEIHKEDFFCTLFKTNEQSKIPPSSNYRREFSKNNPNVSNVSEMNFLDKDEYRLNCENTNKIYGVLGYGLEWKNGLCEISYADIIIPNKNYSEILYIFPLAPAIKEVPYEEDTIIGPIIDKTAVRKKAVESLEGV